jgi:hypothetical protein
MNAKQFNKRKTTSDEQKICDRWPNSSSRNIEYVGVGEAERINIGLKIF